MKIYPVLIVLLIIVVCCEPTKEISWKTDNIPVRLVVDGLITDELKKHTVTLTKTDDYFSNKEAEVVSNAIITISDGNNIFNLEENPLGSGIYKTIDEVKGEVGKTYTLDIQLDNPLNDETHFTTSSVLNQSIRADSMVSFLYDNPFTYDENDTIILVIGIFGHEPEPEGNYYNIKYYRNGDLLNDTIDESSITNDQEYGIDGVDFMTFYINENFIVDDTVKLEIQSISEEYYNFIRGVQKISEGADPFGFSGPPANPVGNIEGGGALGFFVASSVTSISSLVTGQDNQE